MPPAVAWAAVALTLAALVCTVVPHRHGGAAGLRERAGAALMAMSVADMLVPGIDLLGPDGAGSVAWGGLLLVAGLAMLAPRPRTRPGFGFACGARAAGPASRGERARHAGSLVAMAGMWFAMAGPDASFSTVGGAHASQHGLPLDWAVVAASAVLAVAAFLAFTRVVRSGRASRSGRDTAGGAVVADIAAARHPLMATGMLLMALAMLVG